MSGRQWYYVKDGQQHGPISEAGLVELFRQRTLGPATHVWTHQLKDWCKASEIAWLLSTTPPALAKTPAVPSPSSRPRRPTTVTVFGILNIVFGSLGVLSMPCAMIVTFAMPNVMNPTEGAKTWLLFAHIIGFACTILLIALGIGLLNLRAWARTWSLRYGWFAIIWVVLGTLINVALMASGAYGYSENAAPGAIGGFFGGLFGGLLGLVYPILLVVFMQKPNVKNACTR